MLSCLVRYVSNEGAINKMPLDRSKKTMHRTHSSNKVVMLGVKIALSCTTVVVHLSSHTVVEEVVVVVEVMYLIISPYVEN